MNHMSIVQRPQADSSMQTLFFFSKSSTCPSGAGMGWVYFYKLAFERYMHMNISPQRNKHIKQQEVNISVAAEV